MKKSILIFAVILICTASPLFTLPRTYTDTDDPSGWWKVMLGFHYYTETKETVWSVQLLMFGKDLTWIDNDNLGFGCTIGAGPGFSPFIFTIDACYYLDPLRSEYIAFPLLLRGGIKADDFTSIAFLASLTGGLEVFAGHWTNIYDLDPDEELCLDAAVSGGFYLDGLKLKPVIEISGGMSSANAEVPSSGVYYY